MILNYIRTSQPVVKLVNVKIVAFKAIITFLVRLRGGGHLVTRDGFSIGFRR